MITKIMVRDFGVQKFQPTFTGKKREEGVQKTSVGQDGTPKEMLVSSETAEAQKAYVSVKRRRKTLVPGDVVTEAYIKTAAEKRKLNDSYQALCEDLRIRQKDAETILDTTLKTAFKMQKETEQKVSKTMELYKALKDSDEGAVNGARAELTAQDESETLEEYGTSGNLLRRSVIKDGSLQSMEEFSNGKKTAEIEVTNDSKEVIYHYKAGNKAVEFGKTYKGEPYHIKFKSFKRNGSVKTTLEKNHILSLSSSELIYREASGKTKDWTEIKSKGGRLCSIEAGKTVDNKDVALERVLFGDAYGGTHPLGYFKFAGERELAPVDDDGIIIPVKCLKIVPYTGLISYFEAYNDEDGNVVKKEITPGFDGIYMEYVNGEEVKMQTPHSYMENGRLLYESR